jgi:hypothetical protein
MKAARFLMAASAAALIAGSGAALAQQPQHSGGAEKVAPTTGQAPHDDRRDGPRVMEQNSRDGAGHTQPNRAGENRGRGETTGQAPQNERRDSQRVEPNRAPNEPNRATEERGNGRKSDRDLTTGQGAAPTKGPNAGISAQNRAQIHDVFVKERGAPRVEHVDFALAVGTAVPRSVHIVQVPREIVDIEPQWRGYEYFMVGDQVVIVDPRSMEIVAVIDA